MEMNRRRMVAVLGAAASLAGLTPIRAQGAWPQKPVKLVMPHAPGGPTDVVARALAARVSHTLGQQVFVESRVGASGNIGTEYVARATPDGHTVLYQSSVFAIVPSLFRKLAFDPLRSFAPVAMPASINVVLLASKSLPVTSIAEFIQYLKANPGKLSYGSGGTGNITHLGVEVLLQAVGSSAVHVPYKGTAPAMADMLGGQIHFMLDAVSTAAPYVRDQRVRALAVTGSERSSLLPQVPTLAEAGLNTPSMTTWHAMLLPAGTPQSIVEALNAAVNKATGDMVLQQQFAAQGVQLQQSTPAQLEAHLRAEVGTWARVAQAAGVQPE
jgi:tripartite-type tricarboxylate transporter receptor subunit TctC